MNDFFVGSFPPLVFVNNTPLSFTAHVPDQVTIPAQMHCTFGGHGDTKSCATNVLSSFSVIRRSYFRSPQALDDHVPNQRETSGAGSVGVVEGSALGAGSALGDVEGGVETVTTGGGVETGGRAESHPPKAETAITNAPTKVAERKVISSAR